MRPGALPTVLLRRRIGSPGSILRTRAKLKKSIRYDQALIAKGRNSLTGLRRSASAAGDLRLGFL